MTKHGVSYKIVFNGSDYHARLAAVEAGIGLAVMPDSMVPSHLVKAKEYYLPALPPIKLLLCAHLGLETDQAQTLMKQLSALFFRKPELDRDAEIERQVSI